MLFYNSTKVTWFYTPNLMLHILFSHKQKKLYCKLLLPGRLTKYGTSHPNTNTQRSTSYQLQNHQTCCCICCQQSGNCGSILQCTRHHTHTIYIWKTRTSTTKDTIINRQFNSSILCHKQHETKKGPNNGTCVITGYEKNLQGIIYWE